MVRHPHVSRCKALAALVDLGVPETRLMGQIWVIQEVTCARRSSHWLASSLFAMLKTIAIIGVSPIKPVWNHMVRKRRSKRKKIFLLPLGGGVFNNPFKEKWHWRKKLSDFMVVLIGFMLMKIETAIEWEQSDVGRNSWSLRTRTEGCGISNDKNGLPRKRLAQSLVGNCIVDPSLGYSSKATVPNMSIPNQLWRKSLHNTERTSPKPWWKLCIWPVACVLRG